MFKQCIKRKMIITSLALILLIITLTFPKAHDDLENITITYQKSDTSSIYLMNEDNLVARTNVSLKNIDTLEQAKEIITYLTINSSKANYLPIYFKAILPSKTKLLSIDLQEDILKGQRVEKFVVEVRSSKKDAWRVVAEGTTIGYKRLLRIPTCEAKQVRLRVLLTSSLRHPKILIK